MDKDQMVDIIYGQWGGLIFFLLVLLLLSCPALLAAQPVRGVAGDLWADRILGQLDFSQTAPNQVNNASTFNAYGVLVDRSSSPQRMYVYDGGNSRVLGFSNLDSLFVTIGGVVSATQGADILLGQSDFNHSACNRDSNFQYFPVPPTPNASCLCTLAEGQPSLTEGGTTGNMAVDSQGNLYVPDYWNHRILRYEKSSLVPGAIGVAASYVWGQGSLNFAGYQSNQGGLPSPTSLSFFSSNTVGPFVAGVAIDSLGNLWVADTGNNRVLRFPLETNPGDPYYGVPGTTADLVLGQPDNHSFNTNTANSLGANDLTLMNEPRAVRVDNQGNVFVADIPPGSNGRVLVFRPTPTAGMPTYSSAAGAMFDGYSFTGDPTPHGFPGLAGLEWDPSGNLWVSDQAQATLFQMNWTPSFSATALKSLNYILPSATVTGDIAPGYFTDSTGYQTPNWNFTDDRGSVGVDNGGNLFVATGSGIENIWRFPAPIPTPRSIIAHSADVQVFEHIQTPMFNHLGPSGMNNPFGVAVGWGNSAESSAGASDPSRQVIVSDPGRLMFWNMPSSSPLADLADDKPADGLAGTSSPLYSVGPDFGRIREDQAQPQQHLWAIRNWGGGYNNLGAWIEVYNLPLTNNAMPSFPKITAPLPLMGGGSVSWFRVDGMTPDSSGTHVWLTDTANSRVMRIRNPMGVAPGPTPVVDIILGQKNATEVMCNQGVTPSAKTLCVPGSVVLDHHGNLYVSDSSLEAQGNWRLLRWDAVQIPASPVACVFDIPATAVYGEGGSFSETNQCQGITSECGPWAPGFNSDDSVMVLGTSRYINASPFPVVLQNPMTGDDPVAHLNDFGSSPYSATFDDQNNLYLVDLNRNRVMIYAKPFQTAAPPPIPSPTVTPAPTPTDSPTLSPTGNPLSTPTSTPTMTDTRTPTATVTASWSPTPAIPDRPIIYPNPVKKGGAVKMRLPLRKPSGVRVRIYSLAYRKVQDLTFGQVEIGTDPTLPLLDKWGTALANGLYFVAITSDQRHWIVKLVVLR